RSSDVRSPRRGAARRAPPPVRPAPATARAPALRRDLSPGPLHHGRVRLATPMLEPGLDATVQDRVTESMTAVAFGSGDVPVLGTPAVLALAERAACAAIEGRL